MSCYFYFVLLPLGPEVSVMLYPCILCVALLMDLFVLCVYELFGETIRNMIIYLLLLYAFRDQWKECGDSNFQIFSQNCQFHHRRLESFGHFHVLVIYHSEHYGLFFGPY